MEQCGSGRKHAADVQALNTKLYYDLIRMERTPATSTFIDLVSNYDLMFHSIAYLSLQRVGVPKSPIHFTLTTLQDMVHTCRTVFRDSTDSHGGKIWTIPHSPPPQGLGQGNGSDPCIWEVVSTPLLNSP